MYDEKSLALISFPFPQSERQRSMSTTSSSSTPTTSASVAPSTTKTRTFQSAGVLGATGQVGQQVVHALLDIPTVNRVVLVGRREMSDARVKADPRVQQVVLSPFDETTLRSSKLVKDLQGLDSVIVTMGVGQPSKTTPEELIKGDVTLPAAFAASAAEAKVDHISLLTAVGADATATSWFNQTAAGLGLYCQCKGKIENIVKALDFKTVQIFRPAGILENVNSGGFVNAVFPKIEWMLPGNYKNTTATELGQAMVYGSVKAIESTQLPSSPDIVDKEAKSETKPSSTGSASDTDEAKKPLSGPSGGAKVATYLVPRIHELIAEFTALKFFQHGFKPVAASSSTPAPATAASTAAPSSATPPS